MAFPATLDSPKNNWNSSDQPIGHASHHNSMAILLYAIQSKIGIDGSADTTSLDYKVAQVISWLWSKANDSAVLHLAWTETITWQKTFNKAWYFWRDNTANWQMFDINGSDHVYMGWLVNLARKAYVWFPWAWLTTFTITNEMVNGDINFITNGTGAVKVNGVAIGSGGGVDIVSARSFL